MAVLSLNPNRIKLNIKTPSGAVQQLDVDVSESVAEIKTKVLSAPSLTSLPRRSCLLFLPNATHAFFGTHTCSGACASARTQVMQAMGMPIKIHPASGAVEEQPRIFCNGRELEVQHAHTPSTHPLRHARTHARVHTRTRTHGYTHALVANSRCNVYACVAR